MSFTLETTDTTAIDDRSRTDEVTVSGIDTYGLEDVHFIPSGGSSYSVPLGGADRFTFIKVVIDSTVDLPVNMLLNGGTEVIPIEKSFSCHFGDGAGTPITAIVLQNPSALADSKVTISYTGKKNS